MGNLEKKSFEEIKDSVLSKVAGWKGRALSQAGRTTLIKTVVTTMPIYCMSTFILPKGWCEEIDRLLKDFWWGFPIQKTRNYMPRAWDAICLPKEADGLGLRRLFEVNKALIAKLERKLFREPESLWVKTVKNKYKVSNPYLLTESGGYSSWVWCGILKVLPLLTEGLSLLPRNGATVNLRFDPWLPSGQSCFLV